MKPLVSDELWEKVAPLLPRERKPGKKGGRPRVSHRHALTGILFVLRTALPCLHRVLLDELSWVGEIDWSRGARAGAR